MLGLRKRCVRPPRLALICLAVAWPAVAAAQPDDGVPGELVDPWAPRVRPAPLAEASWDVPNAVDVLDPWNEPKPSPAPEFVIIDPWEGWKPAVPTASFPPASLVDPWK